MRYLWLAAFSPILAPVLAISVCGALNLLADLLDWLDRDLQPTNRKASK